MPTTDSPTTDYDNPGTPTTATVTLTPATAYYLSKLVYDDHRWSEGGCSAGVLAEVEALLNAFGE